MPVEPLLVLGLLLGPWAGAITPRTARSADPSSSQTAAENVAYGVMKEVEWSVNRKQKSRLAALMNLNALADRATRGDHIAARDEYNFRRGVRNGVDLAGGVLASLEGGGSYKLLSVGAPEAGVTDSSSSEELTAVFRLATPQGVNYHRYLLRVTDQGTRVEAVDVYIDVSGYWVSETLRQSYLTLMVQHARQTGTELAEADQLYYDHLPDLGRIERMLQAGLARKALAKFQELPELVGQSRKAQFLHATAAAAAGDLATYQRADGRLRQLFPNRPGAELAAFEGLLAHKHFEEALLAIERIDRRVGGDPYLDVLRARVHLAANDPQAARTAAEAARQAEPLLSLPYLTLLELSLQEDNHQQTRLLLQSLQEKTEISFSNITENPRFATFAASAEYQKWKQAQAPNEDPNDGGPGK